VSSAVIGKKVFASGCFDMLHSGHIAFLEEAATYGSLYVCLGSDENVRFLKGQYPICTQDERQYMMEALRCVADCRVSTGWGMMDFDKEIEEIKPDIFIVNEDGNTPAKADFCKQKGIEYIVLARVPHGNLPRRSTTDLRTECSIPYRIDVAGGWLDQPFVSRFAPGAVLTVAIEPTVEFNDRSGMASSTRNKAVELWKTAIPHGDREQLARVLFSYENPPGTKVISGSQDSLGIVLPGLNRLQYDGNYWPTAIESVHDEETLKWIEDHFSLITIGPRERTFNVLEETRINRENAMALASAADGCWKSILRKDIRAFGDFFRQSFEAQTSMFPRMLGDGILPIIDAHRHHAFGWKLSGAGGGGYLILVTDSEIPGAIKIKIRRTGVD
jgi:cytidyltransferase-like protein